MTLVEKVAKAIRSNETVSHDRHIEAKAAIAVVLAEMLEPSAEMEEAADAPFHAELKRQREYGKRAGYSDFAVASGGFSPVMWKAMLLAFAAEHNIALDAAKPASVHSETGSGSE